MHIHCMCILYQSMHMHVYVHARTSTSRARAHTIEICVGAVCAHIHAPLASRPQIKMASFYVYCDELHDIP